MGVSEEVHNKITQLVNMWSHPDPLVEKNGEPSAKRPYGEDKSGPRYSSVGGAGGAPGKGKASDIGVRGKCGVPSTAGQLRSHKGTAGGEIAGPELGEKLLCWLWQLP